MDCKNCKHKIRSSLLQIESYNHVRMKPMSNYGVCWCGCCMPTPKEKDKKNIKLKIIFGTVGRVLGYHQIAEKEN